MELEFFKFSGAGNDFIAINNMDGAFLEQGREALIRDWCRRGMSIGADGALIIEPPDRASRAHFRMRYYNADGGEAETCGNGSRCIARFAFEQGVAPRQMTFQTMAGDYTAEVLEDGQVSLYLTDASGLREGIRLSDARAPYDAPAPGEIHFINTGVPHAVVFADDIAAVPVEQIGRHLRHHAEFAPAGANVNFVKVIDRKNLEVRTYERGVEAETLACGTGCIAASIVAERRGFIQHPVRVKTAGGEHLIIDFEPSKHGARKISLQGSAHIVFRGHIAFNAANSPAK